MTDLAPPMPAPYAPQGASVASSGEVAELRTDLARHSDSMDKLTALVTEMGEDLNTRMAAVEVAQRQAVLEEMTASDSTDVIGHLEELARRLEALESRESDAGGPAPTTTTFGG